MQTEAWYARSAPRPMSLSVVKLVPVPISYVLRLDIFACFSVKPENTGVEYIRLKFRHLGENTAFTSASCRTFSNDKILTFVNRHSLSLLKMIGAMGLLGPIRRTATGISLLLTSCSNV